MDMRRIWTRLLVVCMFSLGSVASYADHAWGTYHWARTANPLPLKVVDSVTVDWQTEFDNTINAWNVASVLDMAMAIDSANDSKKTRRRCKMVTGQMRVCNATYGFNGWLGLATIGIDANGHIVQGTAKVNDSYSSYWTDPAEKNHVMCQEVGHIFGLSHTSEDGSSQGTCMDYSSNPASQWPNGDDYQMLADIYAHIDSYNSYDEGTTGDDGGGGGGCNAPPGKGCNKNGASSPPMGVRVHSGPNHEIWIAARGASGLWIHHVYLAH